MKPSDFKWLMDILEEIFPPPKYFSRWWHGPYDRYLAIEIGSNITGYRFTFKLFDRLKRYSLFPRRKNKTIIMENVVARIFART